MTLNGLTAHRPGRHRSTESVLERRLGSLVALSDDDKAALARLVSRDRIVAHDTDLLPRGQSTGQAIVILDGFACRYGHRSNGQRQIVSYLLPGDLCDPDIVLLSRMDHPLRTLTTCRVAYVSREALVELIEHHPRIARAFRLTKLAEESLLREWLIGFGCRSAIERMAHFFCEMLVRLEVVGLASHDSCDLPVTQAVLADTMGLSSVHVNRTLQTLRHKGFIELSGRKLRVTNLPGLWRLCEFSPAYLRPATLDADAEAYVRLSRIEASFAAS